MDESSSTVRVALIGCTGLLGDIIRQTVSGEPDLAVVAQMTTPGPDFDLLQCDADIVLWNGAEEDRIARWLTGLRHQRAPRVLATLTDGQDAALWELVPHRIELGGISPRALIETIRENQRSRISNRIAVEKDWAAATASVRDRQAGLPW